MILWARHEWDSLDEFTTEELEGRNLLLTGGRCIKVNCFSPKCTRARLCLGKPEPSLFRDVCSTEWEQPAGRAPHVWQAAAAAAKLASISALHNVPIISAMSEAHDEHLLRSRLHFMSLHYAALQAWDEDAEQRIADLAARGDSPLPSLSEGLFWIK